MVISCYQLRLADNHYLGFRLLMWKLGPLYPCLAPGFVVEPPVMSLFVRMLKLILLYILYHMVYFPSVLCTSKYFLRHSRAICRPPLLPIAFK